MNWLATPRPVSDVSPRRARTGVPLRGLSGSVACGRDRQADKLGGTPYRQAFPRMAHPIRPEPLPTNRSRIAPDLLAIAVILAVVLAASLAGVRLP